MKFFVISVLYTMAFSAFSQPAYDIFKYNTLFDSQGNLDLRNYTQEARPDFSRLKQDRSRYSDYSSFLNYLMKEFPDLSKQYVLMHSSGSLQFATKEKPRALLYAGGVMLSLAESPLTNTRKVEILEYDFEKKKFSPNEIVFEPGHDPVFKSNPKSCTSCHGADVKPLWQPYDFWGGAYGSAIGRTATQAETEAYKSLFPGDGNEIYSYLEEFKRENRNGAVMVTGTEQFTLYVTNLNMLRISDRLKALNIGPFIYSILGALKDCDKEINFEEFLPQGFSSSVPFSREQISKDTTDARLFMKQFEIDIFNQTFAPSPTTFAIDHERLNDEINPISKLRYVLESLGISLRSLVMGRGVNSYFMSTPSHFESNLLAALSQDFKPEMEFAGATFYRTGNNDFARPNLECEDIKAAAQRAFQRAGNFEDRLQPRRIRFKSAGSDLPVVGRCIKCHGPNANRRAPEILFHNSNKFAEAMRSTNLKQKILRRIQLPHGQRGAMPPGAPLTTEEIESMKAFLNRF